jgi:hypothetical protein
MQHAFEMGKEHFHLLRSRQDRCIQASSQYGLISSRAASWMRRAILRNGVFGQQRSNSSYVELACPIDDRVSLRDARAGIAEFAPITA